LIFFCKKRALEVEKIWHLGRLVIDSDKLREQNLALQSRQMLHLLLSYSLALINKNPTA
jgi:hypothetical protein